MEKVAVRNQKELRSFLKSRLGDRISIRKSKTKKDVIIVKINDSDVEIKYYYKEFLALIVPFEKKELVNEFIESFNLIMEEHEPICSFDTCRCIDGNKKHTVEWDLKEAEFRVEDILNNRLFSTDDIGLRKYKNIEVYGGRKIINYISNPELSLINYYKAKKYDIDPGFLKSPRTINNLSKHDLLYYISIIKKEIHNDNLECDNAENYLKILDNKIIIAFCCAASLKYKLCLNNDLKVLADKELVGFLYWYLNKNAKNQADYSGCTRQLVKISS